MKKIVSYFRLHFSLSSIVVLLLIGNLIYTPLASFIKLQANNAAALQGAKEVLKDFGINILSDIIATGIIGLIIFFIFKIKYKSSLSGHFTAFDIKVVETTRDGVVTKSEERTPWGEVILTHNLFTNEFRGRLTNTDKNVEIELSAKFERSEYLRGSYIESTSETRRRIGAFLLKLDGNGKNFIGSFVFVDPDDRNYTPQSGRAEWIRK